MIKLIQLKVTKCLSSGIESNKFSVSGIESNKISVSRIESNKSHLK